MLLTLAAVIVVSYSALVGTALWREYGRTIAEAERHSLNTVRLLSGLLAAAVADVDHRMADLAEDAMRTGRLGRLAPPLEAAAVVDADGRLVAGSADLADLAALADGAGPTLERTGSGAWALVFRRPFPGGGVAAAVPTGALADTFTLATPEPGGRIGVTLIDGTLVLQAPYAENWVGERFDPSRQIAEMLRHRRSGTATVAFDRADGSSHLIAYDTVRNAPFRVTLMRPWRTVLAGWRRTAVDAALAGAVVGVVVPTTLVMLFLWMRRVQAAEEARRAAEAANHAKSDFLALMSHELRTPLNSVLGFAEMIRDRAWGPNAVDRYVDYAADIHAAGSHLLSLLNDVLDLAKIEAGRMTLAPEPLDPAVLADACLRLAAGQARASGVSLDAAVAPGTGPLYGDPRALRQIIVNLLSNACKFTPRSGSVRLGIAAAPDGASLVTVSDTGVGMTPQGIAKALQRFGQVENPLTRTQIGTGLGLPMAKGLVELHGGTLSIDSTPGRGTTVTLRFPAAP